MENLSLITKELTVHAVLPCELTSSVCIAQEAYEAGAGSGGAKNRR